MMNVRLLALGVAVAGAVVSGAAMAGASANAALTTNYVWRGLTQTDDGLALQGGADYAADNGLSAGIWASNYDFVTDDGIEYDIYGGYAGKAGDFSYNAGVIRYAYTGDTDAATEVYAGGGFGPVSLTYSTLVDPSEADANYLLFAYSAAVSEIGINAYFGSWGGDDADGSHYGVTASKEVSGINLSATLDISDEDLADDTYFFVMAKKTFEL